MASFIIISILYNLQINKLQKENERIHQSYQEERQELLDRIMSNNIHEFKGATGKASVKRSESGNFLMDRMTASIKKQYLDE
jgi:competence protein ComGC